MFAHVRTVASGVSICPILFAAGAHFVRNIPSKWFRRCTFRQIRSSPTQSHIHINFAVRWVVAVVFVTFWLGESALATSYYSNLAKATLEQIIK